MENFAVEHVIAGIMPALLLWGVLERLWFGPERQRREKLYTRLEQIERRIMKLEWKADA